VRRNALSATACGSQAASKIIERASSARIRISARQARSSSG
jgi:hypothetical protein